MFHVKHRLSAAEFQAIAGVSDDVMQRLAIYLDLLRKWNNKINLVGPDSMIDPWRRHILDSAQLHALLPAERPLVVDLGSGAGFPGLVLAMMTTARVNLVESNGRKCAFLGETARLTGTAVDIHNTRIEHLTIKNADVVTARACASMETLLNFAYPLLCETGVGIFLKGKSAETELMKARKAWTMRIASISSRSDPSGVILKISDIGPHHEN